MKPSTLPRLTAAAILLSTLPTLAQTTEIDAASLNSLKDKPKPVATPLPSKSITKGSTPALPPLKPGEVRFDLTKGARIVSQPDGTLLESTLVEIPLFFDENKATLRTDPVSDQNLRRLAATILAIKDPDARLTISGFASAEGDPKANQVLSEARAKTVRTALIASGISESILSAEGLGSRFATTTASAPDHLLAKDRKVIAARTR